MNHFLPEKEDHHWIERLRKGHIIWLVKQSCFAIVIAPYYPPEPGFITGEITIQLEQSFHNKTEVWWIFPDGKGFDSSQLILPVEDNLPDFPEPLEEPAIIELRRQVAKLQSEVDHLKKIT